MLRFRSFTSAIALAAAACLTACTSAFRTVATFAVQTYELARDFLTSAVASFERPSLKLLNRPIELLQACAYALRLAKRERPQIHDGWRMCPST